MEVTRDRPALVRRGLWLNYLTIGYNLVEAIISVAAGVLALGHVPPSLRGGRVPGGTQNTSPAHTEVQAGDDVPEWARRDSNARPLAPEASALSN